MATESSSFSAASYSGSAAGFIVRFGVLAPVFSVSLTHAGDFNINSTGSYSITVTNLGAIAASGTVNVADTLPSGLTVSAIGGSGWSCSTATITCTRGDSLGVEASYPQISVNVNVASAATSPAVNMVNVSGGGSAAASASDPTVIDAGPPSPQLDSPSNQASAVSVVSTLSWTASAGAASYDVYLGASPAPGLVATVAGTSYVSAALAPGQKYYWQVVAKNSGGSNPSAVWSFMTSASPVPTVVLRDSQGNIRISSYPSATLTNTQRVFASDPSAAQDPNGDTFVVARDSSNAIWANVFDSSVNAWTGWTFGGGIIQGDPSIAVDTGGTGWIASRDTNNSYWLAGFTRAAGFRSWTPLLGVFSSDPVVTACGDGSVYVIGKDNYNSLWSGHYIPGSGFQGWRFGGGIIHGKPSAACGEDNAVYITGEDNFNSNWLARVAGNTWTGWFFGGAITSVTPRIVSLQNGSEAVVILDPTGVVWSATFQEGSGNGWQPWVQVGGILQDVQPAGTGGDLYLAGKTSNGDLWWWQQTGNQWTWIGNNGAAAGALSAAAP